MAPRRTTPGGYGGATARTTRRNDGDVSHDELLRWNLCLVSSTDDRELLRIDLHQLRGVVDRWRRSRWYGGRHGGRGGRGLRRRPMRPRNAQRGLRRGGSDTAAAAAPVGGASYRRGRFTRRCPRDACAGGLSSTYYLCGNNWFKPSMAQMACTASYRHREVVDDSYQKGTEMKTHWYGVALIAGVVGIGVVYAQQYPLIDRISNELIQSTSPLPANNSGSRRAAEDRAPEGVRSASATTRNTHLFINRSRRPSSASCSTAP
jgi:hypothetical protein